VFSVVFALGFMSSYFENKDAAKSDCICDFYVFFNEGANVTLFLQRGGNFK